MKNTDTSAYGVHDTMKHTHIKHVICKQRVKEDCYHDCFVTCIPPMLVCYLDDVFHVGVQRMHVCSRRMCELP